MDQCPCVTISTSQSITVLLGEQYPLPHKEDIFANLAGGKQFSKLDLRKAYHQMEVTEESKKFLTINTHKGLFHYNQFVFWRFFESSDFATYKRPGFTGNTWHPVYPQ